VSERSQDVTILKSYRSKKKIYSLYKENLFKVGIRRADEGSMIVIVAC